jgi:YHS domain-containing protein
MNIMTRIMTIALITATLSSFSFAHEGHDHAADATNDTTAVVDSMAKPAYPIDFCIVSDEKLGEMGKPVVKFYEGREVQFCCDMCPKKFEKNQAKYLKKLDDAIIAKEKPTYPLQTCVVSGEELVHSDMGDPVDYIYNNHLVRFCCNMCPAKFEKEPEKYLRMIEAARVSAADSTGATKSESEQNEQHEEHHH